MSSMSCSLEAFKSICLIATVLPDNKSSALHAHMHKMFNYTLFTHSLDIFTCKLYQNVLCQLRCLVSV